MAVKACLLQGVGTEREFFFKGSRLTLGAWQLSVVFLQLTSAHLSLCPSVTGRGQVMLLSLCEVSLAIKAPGQLDREATHPPRTPSFPHTSGRCSGRQVGPCLAVGRLCGGVWGIRTLGTLIRATYLEFQGASRRGTK